MDCYSGCSQQRVMAVRKYTYLKKTRPPSITRPSAHRRAPRGSIPSQGAVGHLGFHLLLIHLQVVLHFYRQLLVRCKELLHLTAVVLHGQLDSREKCYIPLGVGLRNRSRIRLAWDPRAIGFHYSTANVPTAPTPCLTLNNQCAICFWKLQKLHIHTQNKFYKYRRSTYCGLL